MEYKIQDGLRFLLLISCFTGLIQSVMLNSIVLTENGEVEILGYDENTGDDYISLLRKPRATEAEDSISPEASTTSSTKTKTSADTTEQSSTAEGSASESNSTESTVKSKSSTEGPAASNNETTKETESEKNATSAGDKKDNPEASVDSEATSTTSSVSSGTKNGEKAVTTTTEATTITSRDSAGTGNGTHEHEHEVADTTLATTNTTTAKDSAETESGGNEVLTNTTETAKTVSATTESAKLKTTPASSTPEASSEAVTSTTADEVAIEASTNKSTTTDSVSQNSSSSSSEPTPSTPTPPSKESNVTKNSSIAPVTSTTLSSSNIISSEENVTTTVTVSSITEASTERVETTTAGNETDTTEASTLSSSHDTITSTTLLPTTSAPTTTTTTTANILETNVTSTTIQANNISTNVSNSKLNITEHPSEPTTENVLTTKASEDINENPNSEHSAELLFPDSIDASSMTDALEPLQEVPGVDSQSADGNGEVLNTNANPATDEFNPIPWRKHTSKGCISEDRERFMRSVSATVFSRIDGEPTMLSFLQDAACIGTLSKNGHRTVRSRGMLIPELPLKLKVEAGMFMHGRLYLFDSSPAQRVWGFKYNKTSRIYSLKAHSVISVDSFLQICGIKHPHHDFRVKAIAQFSHHDPTCILYDREGNVHISKNATSEAVSLVASIQHLMNTRFIKHIQSVFSWIDKPAKSVYIYGSDGELYELHRDDKALKRKTWLVGKFRRMPYDDLPIPKIE